MAVELSALLKESVRSGTIASLAMVPFGLAFRALDLRVGHYGPKLAELLFGSAPPGLLFAQHLIIGWFSALPLVWLLAATVAGKRPVLTGALYGAAYYVGVNALGLPLFFGDPLPFQLGPEVIYPSLVVHLVFGASIGITTPALAPRPTAPRRAVKLP